MVATEGFFAGHAEEHIRNVAIEAGAIVLIEADGLPPHCKTGQRLCFLAHIAGVLHDIKRSEPEHARIGAIEAGKLLENLDFEEIDRQMIVKSIANHEAFQPPETLPSPDAQLLSDALYDADKFRWGPENFTDTLWAMLALRKTENIPLLFERFPRSMEGIERIRNTFRTRTGKTYGPDFIDRGLEIGRRLYAQYMTE
jgi:HD superfamily phosphohydrolase YqeK